jgi:hypothetical protein
MVAASAPLTTLASLLTGKGCRKRRGDLYSNCRGADHERHRMWRLTSIALVLAAASATAGAAHAADVTLRVSPETAKLPPAGSAEAVVVVHNPGPKRLLHVVVSVVPPAGVEVEPKRTKPMAIAVGADAASRFTLRQASSGTLPATVLVRADYRLPAGSKKPLLSKVLVSSLPVVLQEAEPLDQVAKVDVRSGLTTLDDFRGGDVVLVVSNTSAGAIRVTDVRPHPKEGVSFDVEDVPRPLWIRPAHQRAIPVAVSLDKGAALRSGPDVLLFTVDLAWGDKAHVRSGSVVVSHDVKFGVFAESEVGELLKIPSFLVLPGFLLVLTLGLLWRAGAHFKRLPNEPILSNVAAFAYFVVLTSMLLIVVYRIRTGRDIRAGYSFGDIVTISRDSILYALVLFGAAFLAHSRYLRWRYPTEGDRDSPITTLKKLGRQGLGLELYEVEIKAGTAQGKAWLYESRDRDRPRKAVGPQIGVEYTAADPKINAEVQKDVNRYRDAKDNPGGLAERLEEAQSAKQVAVRWMARPGLDGLLLVKAADLEIGDARNPVVEEV